MENKKKLIPEWHKEKQKDDLRDFFSNGCIPKTKRNGIEQEIERKKVINIRS